MPMFQGLSAFPITPADDTGRVDVDSLQRLLSRLVDAGVDSIGLLGSTGSYPYLTRSERRRAIAAAVEVTGGQTPLLVGIGALRTDEAVHLAWDAKNAGADALLLAPVSYVPLLEHEVFEHFAAGAAAAGLPLCVYNNPGTTHFTFSPDLLGRLATVPNVVAVKNPAPPADDVAARHRALSGAVADGFSLGYSIDRRATEALIAGGTTWYSVAAGLFPESCLRIVRAVQAGKANEARRLNAELQPLWDLFEAFTSFRVMYAAANRLGLCSASTPRPVLPLAQDAQSRVAETLDNLQLR